MSISRQWTEKSEGQLVYGQRQVISHVLTDGFLPFFSNVLRRRQPSHSYLAVYKSVEMTSSEEFSRLNHESIHYFHKQHIQKALHMVDTWLTMLKNKHCQRKLAANGKIPTFSQYRPFQPNSGLIKHN